jgi:CRISPR-associated endonuclease Csn1
MHAKLLSGRAPYHREIMREAVSNVMEKGIHPTEELGCLYRSEAIRRAQMERAIDEQTNNHLVRHRLLILERLHRDILKEYAEGDSSRFARVTIEVNRDLKEMSGKTAKQVAQDMGLRLSNFKSVLKKLEKAFEGKAIKIVPGLIRKARIAEDLEWTCPFTGKSYDAFDLHYRKVDKDHIIPRVDRPSDSLDSLVITFAEINAWKGRRTAVQFVEEEQGKPVPGLPNLNIKTLKNFIKDVNAFEAYKGHDDDIRRKKNRKRLLLLRDYVVKEFTPRDLTQTSQLVRLGAQALQHAYAKNDQPPVITSVPGSVTGAVRKNWDLLACLSSANSQVMDEAGRVRTKTEIRDITQLHHALDACVLALASNLLPRDGGIWELLIKRRLTPSEQQRMRAALGSLIKINTDGEFRLDDLAKELKEQIRARLAERRVVQHIPKEMTGLRAEQNAWRVIKVEDGEVHLRQRIRQPDGSRITKETTEKIGKVIGLQPGELHKRKAALIIGENYGLALDPVPTIIPFHKVWPFIRELQAKNGGKRPRILRNGDLIRVASGNYAGMWRVLSTKQTKAYGLALDLGMPDSNLLARGNARIANLIALGLEILRHSYCGLDGSKANYAEIKKRLRKPKTQG